LSIFAYGMKDLAVPNTRECNFQIALFTFYSQGSRREICVQFNTDQSTGDRPIIEFEFDFSAIDSLRLN